MTDEKEPETPETPEEKEPLQFERMGKRLPTSLFPMGFGPVSIRAGTTVSVQAVPQYPFRPTRLITFGHGFIIEDLKIGTKSQFVSLGAIPGEAFSAEAIGAHFEMDFCDPGKVVTIVVRLGPIARPNFLVRFIRKLLWISNAEFEQERIFTASLLGEVLQ
jgi:hypothetical protein